MTNTAMNVSYNCNPPAFQRSTSFIVKCVRKVETGQKMGMWDNADWTGKMWTGITQTALNQ